MTTPTITVDVLCVGHASYDLIYSVSHHPGTDEKMFADGFIHCGGGPAANAAVMVANLGLISAFSGYLGNDLYGEFHCQDLIKHKVNIDKVVRGKSPTPLSMVLVKPDGRRALINYKGETKTLPAESIDFANILPKAVLFDGHEPYLSKPLALWAKAQGIPTILDAGSVHEGTLMLMPIVDYLVCSEKFALQWAGDEDSALSKMSALSPNVVITLGERGVRWRQGERGGALPAYTIDVVDTTGAGDAFHGAFAAAVALGMSWQETLRYASAAGSLCCTKLGARFGLPTQQEHGELFQRRLSGSP